MISKEDVNFFFRLLLHPGSCIPRSPADIWGHPEVKRGERAVVVANLNSGCEVALYVVSNNEGKSLLQGDSVVKVTRSFPEFPSRNYTTTGMVELDVEIAEFC